MEANRIDKEIIKSYGEMISLLNSESTRLMGKVAKLTKEVCEWQDEVVKRDAIIAEMDKAAKFWRQVAGSVAAGIITNEEAIELIMEVEKNQLDEAIDKANKIMNKNK